MNSLACGLLAVLLVLAGSTASRAQSTDAPNPEQIKAYLEHRSDPVVGAWIERQLHEGEAVPPPGDQAVPAQQESAGGEMAGYLDSRVGVIEGPGRGTDV